MNEQEISPTQVLVTYRSEAWKETQGASLSARLQEGIVNDARRRAALGWQITSYDTLMTGFSGTAGNFLLNTGGGFATDVVVTVVYTLQ